MTSRQSDQRKPQTLRSEQRAALHRGIDQICDGIAPAKLDARNPGPAGGSDTDNPPSANPQPGATLRANIAAVWLAKIGQLERDIYHQADLALKHWTPPPAGTTIGGVTIGDRDNPVETCGLCDRTVLGGRDDPIRRIDGTAFHAKSCWWTVHRQRQTNTGT